MSHSDRDYWNRRFRRYGDSRGTLKAICSYGMPFLYNKYIDIVQKKAISAVLDRINLSGISALDLGCGSGRWCRILARRGASVTGVDISEEAIQLARRNTSGYGVRFLVSSLATVDLSPQTFDLIICVTVLQHVTGSEELKRSLVAIKRLLKTGGFLVLMEVAPTVPSSQHSTAILSVRTDADYRALLSGVGLALADMFSTDVGAPVQKLLIPLKTRMPRWLFRTVTNLAALVAFPLDYLCAGTRIMLNNSWHKVFLFRNV